MDFLQADATKDFILQWGEAATRYGFSRVAGQIIASLYLAGEPLGIDSLAEITGFARSTLAPAIKELEGTGFILSTRTIGSRKELFQLGFKRPIEIFIAYQEIQRKRYVERVITAQPGLVEAAKKYGDRAIEARVKEVTQFAEILVGYYEMWSRLSPDVAVELMQDCTKKGRTTKR